MNITKFNSVSRLKVNLYLHIVGKRNDGYHNLDSLVAFPEFGDEITVSSSENLNLKITGKLKKELDINNNLIMKAIKLLKNNKKGADIHLKKNIPISAGLGGGSSNAAVTLKLLSKLWEVPLPSVNELVLLGSDIPVCMNWNLQRMRGIGDINSVVNFPGCLWIVLLNDGYKVPTKFIFESLSKTENSDEFNIPKFSNIKELLNFLKTTRNDLEITAIKFFPAIKTLLESFNQTNNCLFSRMSGSGSTCFGLYEKKNEAELAKKQLLKTFPKAWVKVAKIFS